MDGSFGRGLAGVLYAEDFDAPVGAELVLAREQDDTGILEMPEPVEPSFTAAEIDAARAAGRAEGEAQARSALEAELMGERARTVATLRAALAGAGADARRAAEDAADAVARTVLSALAATLPAACARHGEGEVRALVGALLPHLREEPRITVRVSPHGADALRADLAALDDDVAARVHLLCTDAVPPGDVRVSWREGTAARDTRAAWTAVCGALAPLGLLDAGAAPSFNTSSFNTSPSALPDRSPAAVTPAHTASAEPMRMAHA